MDDYDVNFNVLLSYARDGLSRDEIIKRFGGYEKYFEFMNKLKDNDLNKFQSYFSNSSKLDNFVLIAEDYIFSLSESKDLIANFKHDTKYYILVQSLKYIMENQNKLISTNILDNLILNINSGKIIILKEYSDFARKLDFKCSNDINLILKTLISKKESRQYNTVSVMTNDKYTILYSLIRGINIIHSVCTGVDENLITNDYSDKIFVLDTCYILKSLCINELYKNYKKIIFSCVLEEVIKKYANMESTEKNIFYIIVDCIQNPNFDITFIVSKVSSYTKLNSYENDTTLLSEILSSEYDKDNIYILTEDKQLMLESMLYGIKVMPVKSLTSTENAENVQENKETVNLSNPLDVKSDKEIKFIPPNLTIRTISVNKKLYIPVLEKEKLNFDIVSVSDYSNIINLKTELYSNPCFKFDEKRNLVKVNGHFYKFMNSKGENNFKLIN